VHLGRLCDDHLGPVRQLVATTRTARRQSPVASARDSRARHLGIQLGSLFLVLSLQNRSPAERAPRLYGLLAAYVIGILLQNAATIGIEQIGFPNVAIRGYYQVAPVPCRSCSSRPGERCGSLAGDDRPARLHGLLAE